MEALKKWRHKKAFGPFASKCLKLKVWYLWFLYTCGQQVLRLNGDGRSQSRLFQVVKVWHTRPGGASEAVPVLAALDAHLLRVRVALGAPQGGRVPARLQLSRQWIGCLSALQLGRADPWVTPAFCETTLSGGWIRQRLVAHVRRCRLVGGRGRKVQEFAQRLQWLTLTGQIYRWYCNQTFLCIQ